MRDVLLGCLTALGLWAGVSVLSPEPAPAPAPVMVPDDGGPLAEVVLHFDPSALELVAPTYRDLLLALPPETTIWVVVSNPSDMKDFRALAATWGVGRPERLRMAATGRRVTTWSRDRYALLDQGGSSVLLVPPRPTGGNEARLNDWAAPFALALARGFGTRVQVARAVFEGGDLVGTDDWVFATATLRGRNAGGPLGVEATLGSWLRTTTGREPVLIGREPFEVPIHHIGMFVTPVGGRTVLVGDARLGLELLPPDADLPRPVDARPETVASFDRVARELTDKGFDVRRVPLLPLDDGLTYVSYDNALLERRQGALHVYLPQFGFPELDAAGRAAYESLGAVVHPIDVRGIWPYNGTVRCLVNVLRRDPA